MEEIHKLIEAQGAQLAAQAARLEAAESQLSSQRGQLESQANEMCILRYAISAQVSIEEAEQVMDEPEERCTGDERIDDTEWRRRAAVHAAAVKNTAVMNCRFMRQQHRLLSPYVSPIQPL